MIRALRRLEDSDCDLETCTEDADDEVVVVDTKEEQQQQQQQHQKDVREKLASYFSREYYVADQRFLRLDRVVAVLYTKFSESVNCEEKHLYNVLIRCTSLEDTLAYLRTCARCGRSGLPDGMYCSVLELLWVLSSHKDEDPKLIAAVRLECTECSNTKYNIKNNNSSNQRLQMGMLPTEQCADTLSYVSLDILWVVVQRWFSDCMASNSALDTVLREHQTPVMVVPRFPWLEELLPFEQERDDEEQRLMEELYGRITECIVCNRPVVDMTRTQEFRASIRDYHARYRVPPYDPWVLRERSLPPPPEGNCVDEEHWIRVPMVVQHSFENTKVQEHVYPLAFCACKGSTCYTDFMHRLEYCLPKNQRRYVLSQSGREPVSGYESLDHRSDVSLARKNDRALRETDSNLLTRVLRVLTNAESSPCLYDYLFAFDVENTGKTREWIDSERNKSTSSSSSSSSSSSGSSLTSFFQDILFPPSDKSASSSTGSSEKQENTNKSKQFAMKASTCVGTSLVARQCRVCNTPFSKTLPARRCARCRCVYYCSKQCQTQDWQAHKKLMCHEWNTEFYSELDPWPLQTGVLYAMQTQEPAHVYSLRWKSTFPMQLQQHAT